jgi:phosphoribosyl-ATP pyrophosphohydrolase
MALSYFDNVRLWHHAIGAPILNSPCGPEELDSDSCQLGIKLVEEEFDELMDGYEDRNILEIADGAADLIWVLCGLMNRMGIDLDAVWAGVSHANFAKVGGPHREDGKLMKPAGWKPPNTAEDILGGRSLVVELNYPEDKDEK